MKIIFESIGNFVVFLLLAFIVVSCAERIFSEDEPRGVFSDPGNKIKVQNLERDLTRLEYRVRELGFIQRGTGAVATGLTSDTIYLESSYADMNYTLLITGNSGRTVGYAKKINSQSFLVYAGAPEMPDAEYSWLTIGN